MWRSREGVVAIAWPPERTFAAPAVFGEGMTKRTYLLSSAALLAVAVAPFALAAGEGSPLRGGARSPSDNKSQAFTRETEIIANSPTYGTRQSNKSDNGGGAIYGCRSGAGGSAKGNEPCVRVTNLASGFAFELDTAGPLGGTITASGGDNAKPFTTNATGVATGLNADRLDSKNASDITADAVKEATAASDSARPFAQVAANGTAGATRGLIASDAVSRQSAGDYQVVFSGDLTACALAAAITGTTGGEISVTPAVAADKKSTSVDVRTFDLTVGGTPPTIARNPADRGFHLSASC